MRKLALLALVVCILNVLLMIGKILFTHEQPIYNGITAGSFALMAIGCLMQARKEEK